MRIAFCLSLLPTLVLAQPRPVVKPRPHVAPTVRLLEPGAAPLARLRYALDGTQALSVVAGGELAVEAPAGSTRLTYPTLTTPVTLTPAKDQVEFAWRKASFVLPASQQRDTVTNHLLIALEGSGGAFASDARGIISQFFLRPGPSDTSVPSGTMQNRSLYAMEMGKGIVSLLAVPLPEEPVGIGARWQVERLAIRGTISYLQLTTFTLVKRDGPTLELAYRFGGRPDPYSGMRANEVKLGVSGGGTCTLDLRRPLPLLLEDEVLVTAVMIGPDGQQTEQATRVGTRVESK